MELPGEDGKALLDIITVLEKVVAVFWLSVSPAATGAAHIVWISCQGWIVPVKCGTIKWCMQLGVAWSLEEQYCYTATITSTRASPVSTHLPSTSYNIFTSCRTSTTLQGILVDQFPIQRVVKMANCNLELEYLIWSLGWEKCST